MADIVHQLQPTPKSCGHTVLAMLVGVPAADVVRELRDRGTGWRDLARFLLSRGLWFARPPQRFRFDREIDPRPALPATAIVRVDWSTDRKKTHWILWADGRFWDPGDVDEFGWLRRGGRIYSVREVRRG